MQKYITYEDKIGEIIMVARHPQNRNNTFVLVEGIDDVKLYGKFLNDSCKIEPIPDGVLSLEKSLEEIPKFVRKINLIGIRDADFMHIENKSAGFPNLFITDTHDSETMLISSDEAFSAVIYEFLPNHSFNLEQLRNQLLKSVAFLGYLRWYNHINNLEFNFKGLGIDSLIDHTKIIIEELSLIKYILKRSPNAQIIDESIILEDVYKLIQSSHSLLHICGGHDVVKVVAAYFSHKNKQNSVNDSRITSHLRTSYGFNSFQKTELYNSLSSLSENIGLNIFK